MHGFLSRDHVLQKQRESHLLLLLLDSNNAEQTVYPAKVFEYFGARRPIIALGGTGGLIKKLLSDTETGIFVENYQKLEVELLKYYKQFVENEYIPERCNHKIEKYTYNSIAQEYAHLLNKQLLS